MNKAFIFSMGVAAVATGCTLTPKLEKPSAPIAGQWPTGGSSPASMTNQFAGRPVDGIGWRDFFVDPRLQKLIELALTNNRDLRVAMLNVEELRAQYRIRRAGLIPEIDGVAGASRSRIPANVAGFSSAITTTQYGLSLGLTSYELDFFGRARSLKASALESYLASESASRSARVSLVSEVAAQYLYELELEEQLAVARQTLESVQASYKLNQRSYELGKTTELDVRTAEAQVQTARANVAAYTRLLAQAQNALALVVGQRLPGELPAIQPLSSQSIDMDLPAGLPSDLLLRRPDIVDAEHQLAAANANVGAARAAFFPSITLTGSFGTSSSQLKGLFGPGSAAWSFAPQLKIPIFELGRNVANLDVAKVRTRIEVAKYEKAIQSAFREVADALVARSTLVDQLAADEALVSAQSRRLKLAEIRYRNGVDSYLVVLSAQQDLYTAQQSLLQVRLAKLSSSITLYKALGGGWVERSSNTATAAGPK